MNIFYLKECIVSKIELILKESNISHKEIKNLFNFNYDYEDTLGIINKSIEESGSSQPLFSNDNKFVQNVIMAKIFKKRIEEVDRMEYIDYSMKYQRGDIVNAKELELILNGHYIVNLFQENFINLDWKEKGFISAEELFYSMGAHIANITDYKDSREITVHHTSEKHKDIISFYGHHTHGDFRISQYSIKNKSMLNPFCKQEILPFSYPVITGNLAGHYSVEHVFLSGLLALSLKEKEKLPVIDKFEEFNKKLKEEGQKFGNFGDAGCYSKSMSTSTFSHIDQSYISPIPLEYDGYYKASLEDNKLVYRYTEDNKVKMTIYPEMINELICGLFEKVNVGNGRSSTVELADCVEYFKDKFYNK